MPLVGSDPDPYRHQVVDIPPVLATAVEYRLHTLACAGCGTTTKATLPEGVSSRVFGPRLTAAVSLLSGDYRLSKRQIAKLLEDFFGVELSLGSVVNLEQEAASALAPCHAEALEAVRAAPVVNADETGWTENKRRAWLWVAVTVHAVAFLIRKTRAGTVARELLGQDFKGILGTDRYGGYAWLDAARRQLCWAHLKRDFALFAEYGTLARALSDNLQRERKQMLTWWRKVRDGTLSRANFQNRMKPVRENIIAYLQVGAASAPPKVAGMCREILLLESALFTFVDHEGVEPTNNVSEQAVRRGVIWRKISFGTDSERGSRFVERILTATATLRLYGKNALEFMTDTISAYRVGTATPSLLRPASAIPLAA